MTISVFISFWISGVSSAQVDEHFRDAPLAYLRANPEVVSVEHYVQVPNNDMPPFDDHPVPVIIIQADFESEEAAIAMVESDEFKRLYNNANAYSVAADDVKVEITEQVHYDLPGHDTPPARTQPLSFVVRYYGPVKNSESFVDFYTKNHPQIVAKLPGARNVLCYLPIGWKDAGEIADDRLVIGNEVVFDSLDALKTGLQSPVLEEANADADLFEPWGYSSHHPLLREFVYQR